MKIRHGGLAELEQRVLDGETRALRALVRQATGPNTLDVPFHEVAVRASANGTGGTKLTFTGYASTTEDPYSMADWLGPYTEVVRAGAFAETLKKNPDVVFCLNHNWDTAPMARTNKTGNGTLRLLSPDDVGLPIEALMDGQRADVYQVQSAMEAGDLNAMSFAFWVTRQVWSPDFEQRDIVELDMDGGDTSVVTWPANPGTAGTTALRKRQAVSLMRSRIPGLIVERARTEKRAGKSLSTATLQTLQAVLDLVADADVSLDSAQPMLAELMGVDNPDTETVSTQDVPTETPTGPGPAAVRKRLALLADAS